MPPGHCGSVAHLGTQTGVWVPTPERQFEPLWPLLVRERRVRTTVSARALCDAASNAKLRCEKIFFFYVHRDHGGIVYLQFRSPVLKSPHWRTYDIGARTRDASCGPYHFNRSGDDDTLDKTLTLEQYGSALARCRRELECVVVGHRWWHRFAVVPAPL